MSGTGALFRPTRIAALTCAAVVMSCLGDRGARVEEADPKPAVGSFRGVSISHIVGDGIGRTGCAIAGLPGRPIGDISIEDVSLRLEGGGTLEDARRLDVPERPNAYPEATMFGVLPAYGFYARHVRNLRLRNLDLGFRAVDARPPLVAEDVDALQIADSTLQCGPAAECLVRLRNVRNARIHEYRAEGPCSRAVEQDAQCTAVRADAIAAPDPERK